MIVPVKWQKYQALVEYDLLCSEVLAQEVHRYHRHNTEALLQDVARLLSGPGNDMLFVIKLVDPNAAGSLPNFRMTDVADLHRLQAFIDSSDALRYPEVWCCGTSIDMNQLSVSGRFLVPCCRFSHQIVEQLWRCSPRMLEYFHAEAPGNVKKFPHPYVRASRIEWGYHYNLEMVYEAEHPRPADLVNTEFVISLHCLEASRTRVQRFVEALSRAGVPNVSLEYKIVGDRIWFIDWDTVDDGLALRRLRT